MRIFIGGIEMESNSFSPVFADVATFRRGYWLEGDEIQSLRHTTMDVSGFYEYFDSETGIEVVPGFIANAVTSGQIKQEDFQLMSDKLFSTVEKAGKVDGVLLALHGAMQSEIIDDCEGYILENIRKIVGEQTRIVAVCDLHACLTVKMMEYLDGVTGYMTYPHTDHNNAGFRAAKSLAQILRTGIKPYKILHHIPMVMPVENCNTNVGPIMSIMDCYKRVLEMPGVSSGGLFLTQPWLDTAELGCQMGLFFEEEYQRERLDKMVCDILYDIWNNKQAFFLEIPGIDEALAMCNALAKPVCVVELGDIVSAGGAGDSTIALDALLKADLDIPACLVIIDPDTVHAAQFVGVENEGCFMIGGVTNKGYNRKIAVKAKVMAISSEPFRNVGESQKGVLVDGGVRVLLRDRNINIIACEYSCNSHDRNMLTSIGINPSEMSVIIQKTHQMFKAGYAGVMQNFLYADTPGYTDRNLKRLPFQRIKRPLYPFDEIMDPFRNKR